MFRVPEGARVVTGAGRWNSTEDDGNNGAFLVIYDRKPFKPVMLNVIASDGEGWEHVSVSVQGSLNKKRTPTWAEMCHIKDLFWDKEDTVLQYHPAESEYVNNHPYVLHLWRPVDGEGIPTPPHVLVGSKLLNYPRAREE